MNTKEIIIYTDGSSSGNPGPGGWGAIVATPDANVRELGGRESHSTNNRMELQAAIQALKHVKNFQSPAVIHTDSSYVIQGITKWVHGWVKNNWRTATKTEVINKDLWQELFNLEKSRSSHSTTTWRHVSGHSGVPGNERVDEIATAYTFEKEIKLFNGAAGDYKVDIFTITPNRVVKQVKDFKRAHSNAKAYSYISMINGEIKTHRTWAECEARVKGKPAKFKKALSREDEETIIASFRKSK
ncbi:MAG: ribonuclease HI [Patescibacteria group bacterium]